MIYVGLNHILWIGFFSWFPMIYCWIESHPVDWVFPLISCDLLLDWITSCELAFSLDFPWFTVELNHIPWIGFFSWFPVIYCQIESHPVNWVFPAISCLIELHPVHLVILVISHWIESHPLNLVFPWFPVELNHNLWIKYWHPEWDVWYDWTKDYYNWLGGRSMIWWAFGSLEGHVDGSPCIVVCEMCPGYLWQ